MSNKYRAEDFYQENIPAVPTINPEYLATGPYITDVKPLTPLEKGADHILLPLMQKQSIITGYVINETGVLVPMQDNALHEVHMWHQQNLTPEQVRALDPTLIAPGVFHTGTREVHSIGSVSDPRNHFSLPGAKHPYSAMHLIESNGIELDEPWFIGWLTYRPSEITNGMDIHDYPYFWRQVCRLPIQSRFVKAMVAAHGVQYFGINSKGYQIPVKLAAVYSEEAQITIPPEVGGRPIPRR